ncbi:MAG: hypothetical protein L0Z52_00645, partial [Acidobacteria bacterium]|nr:hypothetical protein [Acidobacteriota bacterium]
REGEPETDEAIVQAILSAHPQGNDYRAALAERKVAHPPTGYAPIPFVDFLPWTPDQKIHLFSEELDRIARNGLYAYEGDPATSRYPLTLISPASGNTVSSMLGQTWKREARLEMHPEDARSRGIGEGDAVRVFNELGEVRVRARVSPAVRPGVVVLPKGLWSRHTLNGATANALSPDSLSDIGGGACFNDARVEVQLTEPLS